MLKSRNRIAAVERSVLPLPIRPFSSQRYQRCLCPWVIQTGRGRYLGDRGFTVGDELVSSQHSQRTLHFASAFFARFLPFFDLPKSLDLLGNNHTLQGSSERLGERVRVKLGYNASLRTLRFLGLQKEANRTELRTGTPHGQNDWLLHITESRAEGRCLPTSVPRISGRRTQWTSLTTCPIRHYLLSSTRPATQPPRRHVRQLKHRLLAPGPFWSAPTSRHSAEGGLPNLDWRVGG